MKFWNKMKKNSKGFTLVEIIVVLVILAVLAAFTIPTMLGFVNEARGKALIAEAREVYVAAQATATEYGAQNDLATAAELGSSAFGGSSTDPQTKTMRNYLSGEFGTSDVETTDPGSTVKENPYWTVTLVNTGTTDTPVYGAEVESVIYIRNGYKVTLNQTTGATTVEKL